MYCARCNQQGSIYKALVNKTNEIIYVCDECDATWPNPADILKCGKVPYMEFIDFETFLEDRGLDYMTTPITQLGYDWDKSVLGDDSLTFCPRCGAHGIIYETYSQALEMTLYFCDTCDAMWHRPQDINPHKFDIFLTFLQSKGLNYSKARLSPFIINWAEKIQH